MFAPAEIECVEDLCVKRPGCTDPSCWLREGFRLAVDVLREVVTDGGALTEDLPRQMCLEATALVPGWELTGPQYQAVLEDPSPEVAALIREYGWADDPEG